MNIAHPSSMQTEFTEDQITFRDVVSRFLRDKSPTSVTRQLVETEMGYDPQIWSQLCNELGVAGIHFPESQGGFGFGPVELGIVAEEMGRHLYCGPFLASSIMAGSAVMIGGSDAAKDELLPQIAEGSTILTLVLDNLDDPRLVGKTITADNSKVSGKAPIVVDAQNADQLVVIASESEHMGLYRIQADSKGVEINVIEGLDSTRKLSEVSFSQADAERIGAVDEQTLEKIWDYICVALAHEMIGGAQHLFETTVEYTKMRYQFGRPIGSFQALKHRCVDLLMDVEFASAATHQAAFSLANGVGDDYVPSMAKAMASDCYMKAAREAVQMRGGIGFTWEEDTQLWFKRAKSSEVFMGGASMHRERMMRKMETQLDEF